MLGLMMDVPLLITDLIRFADRNHGDTEIVSKTVEGGIHRYTYREAHARARRLAKALQAARKGRATLLGDAAHPMLQYLAQGAGMAIEDAWVLADCVASAGGTPEALREAMRQDGPQLVEVMITDGFGDGR